MARTFRPWRESTSRKLYRSSGKELPDWAMTSDSYAARRQEAYWRLAEKIDEEFGPEGATIKDIHYKLLGPMGLPSPDSMDLVKAAYKEGYLE